MKSFVFPVLLMTSFLLSAASVNKQELMEKSQWRTVAGAVFGNQCVSTAGRIVMTSVEKFKVNPRQIWLLTGSFRAKDGGMCRLGFLPLDMEGKPFRNSKGGLLYLWCARSSDLGVRWKEVSGGIAGFSGNDNVTVQWNPGAVSACIVLSCEGTLEITDLALDVLEE